MSETTEDLLVIKVATQTQITQESVASHLGENIQAEEVIFEDASFQNISDVTRIKKIYKIAPPPARKGNKQIDSDAGITKDQINNLEVQILGAMALRGAT